VPALSRRSWLAASAAVLLAVAYYTVVGEWPALDSGEPQRTDSATSRAPPHRAPVSADEAIERAFRERRSDLWVEAGGVVEKRLTDDRKGSRHQRFILRLENGRTLLVAHNIDLAERVPLREGDRVLLRGEYEWNDRGGVVHWTHHDPDGRHAGGWIEHEGRRYR
jgi:hypothetical protein